MHKTATLDPRLHAILKDVVPLAYADGASLAEDRPGHIRAASALRRRGARLVIVQDDVNLIGLWGDEQGVAPILLPLGPGGLRQFDDGRGNKHSKMDLEACVTLPGGRVLPSALARPDACRGGGRGG
jgi:hypothetical protein